MSNTLSPELKKQIEQEADEITAKMKDSTDFQAGIVNGYGDGYQFAGEKYALKWEQAEQLIEQMAKALETLSKISGIYLDKDGFADLTNTRGVGEFICDTKKISTKALTDYNNYKQGKYETL